MSEASQKPRRRRLRFSLRTLMLLFVLICIPLGLEMNRLRNQQFAVAEITRAGGYVAHRQRFFNPFTGQPMPLDDSSSRGAQSDILWDVVTVRFYQRPFPDESIPFLQKLPKLENLDVSYTDIDDTRMKNLARLTRLKYLRLDGNKIAGPGLACLSTLRQLKRLSLDKTQIADEYLAHLTNIGNLEELWLNDTQITDAGLKHVAQLTSLRELFLEGTNISEAGLLQLQRLPHLEFLWLSESKFTHDCVARLHRALPTCVFGMVADDGSWSPMYGPP